MSINARIHRAGGLLGGSVARWLGGLKVQRHSLAYALIASTVHSDLDMYYILYRNRDELQDYSKITFADSFLLLDVCIKNYIDDKFEGTDNLILFFFGCI